MVHVVDSCEPYGNVRAMFEQSLSERAYLTGENLGGLYKDHKDR